MQQGCTCTSISGYSSRTCVLDTNRVHILQNDTVQLFYS